ncbi:hypothetical protein [Castellaniella sp.]|uniref:hypothetical protein n=1 Tax=Castellaniella sp. TaxID=1955812 RepID=UPI002AFE7150|nr:hypothetical protein [Castellaniella sp.]
MMTALAISALNTSISADPRIEDLRIAKALGYAVPRMIRKLIARHIKPLQRFGEVCSTVEQTGEKGGRPAKAYWLNKKQALYICTKSETEKATEATIEMVEVFDAYLEGKSAPSIPVRAHTRRRPDTSPRHILPSAASGHGAIILNGEIITYDTTDFDVMRGDVVLVILSNGEIEVNEVGGPHGAQIRETQEFGPRTIGSSHRIMTAMRRGEVRHLPVRYCGMIIGRVIDRKPVQKAA